MRYIPTASIDGKTEARLPIALTARGWEERREVTGPYHKMSKLAPWQSLVAGFV